MKKIIFFMVMFFLLPSSILANGETYTEPSNLHMYKYIQQPTPLGLRTLMSVAPLSATATSDDVGFTESLAYRGYLDDSTKYSFTGPAGVENMLDNDLTTSYYSANQYATIKITFKDAIDIKNFYYSKTDIYSHGLYIYLTTESGVVHSRSVFGAPPSALVAVNLDKVKTLEVGALGVGSPQPTRINEIEVFEEFVYQPVLDLRHNATSDSITYTYAVKKNEDGSNARLKINNVYVDNLTEYTIDNLTAATEYTTVFTVVYSDGTEITKEYKASTARDTTAPADVTGINASIYGQKDVLLTYTLPTDSDFSHLKIERDGVVIANNIKTATYTDMLTQYEQKYKYKVIAIDTTGNASDGVTVELTTPEEPELASEVTNLKAVPTQEKVSLTWLNTTHEDFETVTIYRKEKQSMMRSLFSLFSTPSHGTPLFQTNGTLFNDLTVASDTAYTYTVTTTVADVESAGVSIDVTTPPASIVGGGVDPVDPSDPTSDYVVTWDLPTAGNVKIIVGGVDYVVVAASLQSYTIPNEDMEYDFFGNPDVQIVPVDDTGGEIGAPVTPSSPGTGGMLPGPEVLTGVLDANEMVIAGIALFGLIAGFILLRLAFMFVPKMIKMIQQSNQKRVIK